MSTEAREGPRIGMIHGWMSFRFETSRPAGSSETNKGSTVGASILAHIAIHIPNMVALSYTSSII